MMLWLDSYLNVILKAGAFLHLLMFDQGRLSSEKVDCTGVKPYSLFSLLEQIEVLFSRYEHYLLLLSTMYM